MFLNIVENSQVAPQYFLEFPVRSTGWAPAEWSEMMADELESSGTIAPVMKTMSSIFMFGSPTMAETSKFELDICI